MAKVTKEPTHDKVLSDCFIWLWNTYPQTRLCCFHVKNESKPERVRQIIVEFLKISGLYASLSTVDLFCNYWFKKHIIQMSQDKAIGIVPGVLDLLLYWKGALHAFDVKIGQDRLSTAQQGFISAIEKQGGKAYVISSQDEFEAAIKKIVLI